MSKRKTIPKTVKDKLWDLSFGPDKGSGKCYCCGLIINSKKFDAGHIVSVAKGGSDKISNLKPICSTCNKSMGTENMDEFKKRYFTTDVQSQHSGHTIYISGPTEKSITDNVILSNISTAASIINQHEHHLYATTNKVKKISDYFQDNTYLEILLTTTQGITNYQYLKQDTVYGFVFAMSSKDSKYSRNPPLNKDIQARCRLIKIIISMIAEYNSVKDCIDQILMPATS